MFSTCFFKDLCKNPKCGKNQKNDHQKPNKWFLSFINTDVNKVQK